MSETCNILLAGKDFLCEIVTFSRNVMVMKTNLHPKILVISLKQDYLLKLWPGNALFVLKMQCSLKKKKRLSLQTSL